MARHSKTGRSKSTGAFLKLDAWLMDTAAWRALTPQERAVFIEIARLYNGKNNGFLALGVRGASERANCNKDTASRCFKRLLDLGFIEQAQAGAFSQNSCKATEWRLTQYACDRTHQLPSKAFARWAPNPEACPKRGTLQSQTRGQQPSNVAPLVPRLRTVSGGFADV